MKILRIAFLSIAACGGAQKAATPSADVEHPSGKQVLAKGQTHKVEINAGETHEWGIDLKAGEPITLAIEASSTKSPTCTNWTWGFYNPAGGVLREQPKGPADSGQWSDEISGTAEASIVEGPTAGVYLVRIATDPTGCPQLRYTLTAR
jgi:hypothetical protein